MKDILVTLEQVKTSIKSIDDRLRALEEKEKSEASPAMQDVSEAAEKSLIALKELTNEPGKWASIQIVAKRTGRSPPTESGYLRYLYQLKRLDRRAKYVGTGTKRRRILEYRPKA